jgi:endonuclease/exonuclease/phosphatase family metal-dependent hydrolase
MSRPPRRTRRAAALLLALALLITGLVAGAAQAATQTRPVKVMTRNLYLGADLTPAITAPNAIAAANANYDIFQIVGQTNFPERAKVLANEIVDQTPDLIGLQEAAMWRKGPLELPPSTNVGVPNATTVVYDYLENLRSELALRGEPYDIVVVQDEADLEGGAFQGNPFIPGSGFDPSDAFDIRLTQRDAILVRRAAVQAGDVVVGTTSHAYYGTQLTLPTAAGPKLSRRGWVSANVTVKGRAFRFVDTHLEAFHAYVRAAQAGELGQTLVPTSKVVLVGDLNSAPDDTPPTPPVAGAPALPPAFAFLTTVFGYQDTWAAINADDPGFTSGFNELVNDTDTSGIDHRIDHVLQKGSLSVLKAKVTGTDPANRTPGGLWPSDHAGVVTKLQP